MFRGAATSLSHRPCRPPTVLAAVAATRRHVGCGPTPRRWTRTRSAGDRASSTGPRRRSARDGPPSPHDTRRCIPLLRAAAERQLGPLHRGRCPARRLRPRRDPPPVRRPGRWVRLRRGVYVTAETSPMPTTARPAAPARLPRRPAGPRPADGGHQPRVGRPALGLPGPRSLDDAVRLTDPDAGAAGRGYDVTQAPLRTGGRRRGRGPLRLTAAARTLLDCAREWPLEDAVVAMDAALLAGRTTRAAARRRPSQRLSAGRGARRAARAVALADGRAESPLETRGRLRIVGAGFPTPNCRWRSDAAAGLVAVVDAWFEEAAVAVEFDGRVKYTDPWRGRSPERVAVGGEAPRGRTARPRHPRRPDRRRRPRPPLAFNGTLDWANSGPMGPVVPAAGQGRSPARRRRRAGCNALAMIRRRWSGQT